MFCKRIGKNVFIFCTLAFVAGLLMALFLPPTVIAVVECILLIVLCFCFYNNSLF